MPTGHYRLEVRPGWKRDCPYCGSEIHFTKLVNVVPFFYSDGSNDVLLRASDVKRIQTLIVGEHPIEKLAAVWDEILQTAPPPPGGGHFSLWANIKCPSCGKEFPYNNGVRDLNIRLHDPDVILIDGAVVVGDTIDESWRVSVKLPP